MLEELPFTRHPALVRMSGRDVILALEQMLPDVPSPPPVGESFMLMNLMRFKNMYGAYNDALVSIDSCTYMYIAICSVLLKYYFAKIWIYFCRQFPSDFYWFIRSL